MTEVRDHANRSYVPVGWVWEEGVRAAAACVVEGTMHKDVSGTVRAAAAVWSRARCTRT